jgi:hypothetical protein
MHPHASVLTWRLAVVSSSLDIVCRMADATSIFGGAPPLSRPRRNRKHPAIREAHSETWLAPAHFVLPLFIHDGAEDVPVQSMPGRNRLSLPGMMKEVEGAVADGIHMIEVFPAVSAPPCPLPPPVFCCRLTHWTQNRYRRS